jgi:hypothetical protein
LVPELCAIRLQALVLLVALLLCGAHARAQALTTICQFNNGPRAGTVIDFAPYGVQPFAIGYPCTDGVSSYGIAIASYPSAALAPSTPFTTTDPREIIRTADQNLQNGNIGVFGGQLQLVIMSQTNNTGKYQPLIDLGAISDIAIGGVQQVPNGIIVQGRAFHKEGYADWTLGYSTVTRLIEFGNFNPYSKTWNGGVPGTASAPAPTTTTGGPTTTDPVPPSQDDACKKYPSLC